MNNPLKTPVPHQIRLEGTDGKFPRHWLSGSLKYDEFAPLAEGGTAVLQSCLDKNLGRVVAYKTLQPDLVDSEVETMRFLREARVTSQIAHPGTVPVYELGRDKAGNLFFTMKKLVGQDLHQIFKEFAAKNHEVRDRFPLTRLVDILIQVCHTVAYAHAHGVIHRDLKPANILIGEFGEVVVLDWGLAKVFGESDDVPHEDVIGERRVSRELTQPGKRYGTPMYMSPEQADGVTAIDERSDVFNLGIMLFEMITEKDFVFGNTVDEILKLILERPTPIPHEVSPQLKIPPELESICLRALSRKPEDRYASVKDLGDDLQCWRDHMPVSCHRYPPWKQMVMWNQNHALLVTGVLCTIAGIVVGLLLG